MIRSPFRSFAAVAFAASLASPALAQPGDYVKVLGSHDPAKPTDPVEVRFTKFKVTEARLDPEDLRGATATLEVDLTSLQSGSDKRDRHLRSADYIDTSKHTSAVIKVGKLAKVGNEYRGAAEITTRGVTKALPVTITVLATTASTVRVRGELAFQRSAFGVGKVEGDPVANAMRAVVELELPVTPAAKHEHER
jgi:polyisoprenoid-binding protein YceI